MKRRNEAQETVYQQWQRYRNEAKRNFDNKGKSSVEAKRTHLFQNLERQEQSEHYYYCSSLDRRENEHNQSEALQHRSKTITLKKNLCRIERKQTGLVQNFTESKQSERKQPLYKQDRRENEVQSPAGSKREQTMRVSHPCEIVTKKNSS